MIHTNRNFEYLIYERYGKSAETVLWELYSQGYSFKDTAKKLRFSVPTIHLHAKKYGIEFKHNANKLDHSEKPKQDVALMLNKKWI